MHCIMNLPEQAHNGFVIIDIEINQNDHHFLLPYAFNQ